MRGVRRTAALTVAALAAVAVPAAAMTAPAAATVRAPAAAVVQHTAKPGATLVCGTQCTDYSSELFGPGLVLNATNVGGSGPFKGRIINLRAGGNNFANEDFIVDQVALLHQLCPNSGGNGNVAGSSYACLTVEPAFPNAPVVEIEAAPFSNDSGYCVGALDAINGFKARLRLCGTHKSYWIADPLDADWDPPFNYMPLIFGADTAGSHPLVMAGTSFTTRPARQVRLGRLRLTSDGAVSAQLWVSQTGPFS